jgi:hypothetical protein
VRCAATTDSLNAGVVGAAASAANCIFTSCDISANYIGLLEVAGTSQNHHGVISSCSINHCGLASILIYGAGQGEIIANCQIRGSPTESIRLDGCEGIDIHGCQIDNLTLTNVNTPNDPNSGRQACNFLHDNTYFGFWATNVFLNTDGHLVYWHNFSYNVQGDSDGQVLSLIALTNQLPANYVYATGGATSGQFLFSDANYNTSVGIQSGGANGSGSSTAVGQQALFKQTTGGAGNDAVGIDALYNVTTGQHNAGFGGYTLYGVSTASGSTAIGESAGLNATGANNIYIGYNVQGVAGESGIVRIGTNGSQTDVYLSDGVAFLHTGRINTSTNTTNHVAFQVTQTNWVAEQTYTNTTGYPQTYSGNVVLKTAAVTGDSGVQIAVAGTGGDTNTIAIQTTVAVTLAMTYTNTWFIQVPNTCTFILHTNITTGTGNSATLVGGQLFQY